MASMWEKFKAWVSGWPISDSAGDMDEPELIEWAEEESNDPPKLESMTKKELEAYGRTIGIELDRRKSKAKLIAELGEHSG